MRLLTRTKGELLSHLSDHSCKKKNGGGGGGGFLTGNGVGYRVSFQDHKIKNKRNLFHMTSQRFLKM